MLGEHAGVHQFTVGQRKGLGISSREPLYVIATEPATQTVIVGRDDELLRDSCLAKDVNWISIERLREPNASTGQDSQQARCGRRDTHSTGD